jgi:hypothetical protein
MDRPPTLRDRAAGVQRRGAGWGRVAVLIGSSGTISRDAPIARCRGRRSRSDVSVMAGRRPARVRVGGRLWLCADRWEPKGRLSAGVGGFVRTDGCREGCSWPAFVAVCGETTAAGRLPLAASRKTRAASRKTRAACHKLRAERRFRVCGVVRKDESRTRLFGRHSRLCAEKRATGALPATMRAPPAISMGDLQRCAVDGELLGGERVRGRRVHDRAVGDRELAAVTATVDRGRDVGVRSAAAGVQPGVGWRPDLDDSDPGLLAGCPEEVHPRLRGWVDELIKKEAIGAQLFESDVTAIRAFGSERLCRLQQSGARFVGPQSQDRDGATACGTGRAPTG